MKITGRILVVDNEANATSALEKLLREDGHEVVTANDGLAGLQSLESFNADVVLTDLRMPGLDGLKLLTKVRELSPETLVIVTTAHGSVKTAVQAMKLGAEDYLPKPIDVEELEVVIQRALEKKELRAETLNLRERLARKYNLDNLVGDSPEILAAFKAVRQVAPTTASVLLVGESGTGKELFAQALHQNSPRRDRPFVKVACGALPESLLESELFGHEKGSFTGALFTRPGRFEMANGGTLFLDEIGDITPTVQLKLLRFLEQHEFERVGGNETYKVDVRVVVATHRDLEKRVAEGAFREDLYYRLNVIQVHIPPLRERGTDIVLLAHHFMRRYAAANGKDVHQISDAAAGLLLRHPWPGNVRELETEIEREAIIGTLEAVSGSTSRAAAMLGISPRKIQYKVKEYHRDEALRAHAH